MVEKASGTLIVYGPQSLSRDSRGRGARGGPSHQHLPGSRGRSVSGGREPQLPEGSTRSLGLSPAGRPFPVVCTEGTQSSLQATAGTAGPQPQEPGRLGLRARGSSSSRASSVWFECKEYP